MEDRSRRDTFGRDPDRYDRARPDYPEEILSGLIELAGLAPRDRVLEVGCGTGKATRALLRRGLSVDAVELSGELAEFARRRLAGLGPFRVVVRPFETWTPPPGDYDAVVAVSSFHWVDPAVRFERAAEALRRGGALALVQTTHVAGGDRTFFERSQVCYEAHWPNASPGYRLPEPGDVSAEWAGLTESARFDPPVVRTYLWEQTYTTAEYLDLLRTFSDHASLPPDARERLLQCLGRELDSHFHGRVRKAHLTHVTVARRRA